MIGYIAPFKILDYLDRLNVVKQTGSEYHCTCPVCGNGGFKIEKKSGKYQAFKCGCQVKDIREAVRPWSEVTKTKGDRKTRRQRNEETGKRRDVKEVELTRLPQPKSDRPVPESNPIPDWLVKQGIPATATQTRYWYSKTQWVSRFEWKDEDGNTSKTIRQGHVKTNGLIQWKKGSKDWRAYKLTEAVKYCQNKWVLGLEGEGCVETARARAIAAITWQGSNWEISRIITDLTILIEARAAGLVYFPDKDEVGEKKAELVEQACQSVGLPCLILEPTDVWKKMPDKGDITDWVEAHPNLSSEQLTAKLAHAIAKLAEGIAIAAAKSEQSKIEAEEQKRLANLPNWSQSDIALWLAEKYREQLAWNTDTQEWYRYSSVTRGIWSVEPVEFVGQLVNLEIETLAKLIAQSNNKRKKPSYTISTINGAIALLKMNLAVRRWNEVEGLLPLLNGVLDLKTRKLLPHSPENRLTWCLPYEYNILATSSPIQEWLLTMCGGDRALVQLMRAYLLGILTGRTDWQKYLELIGPGGTGKSTFTRLATALVGTENVHTTTLHKLEKSKFEPASIAGKRLVLINDSERYAGDVGHLKNLTGQDTLPFEVKFKQSKGGFNPDALVIVSTNEIIQSSDYTSGLARRRISIPMEKQIKSDRQKNLIEHKNGEMYGEFLPYIPGLLNWVLEMDEESATSIVKNYEIEVPSLLAMKNQTLVETNPIADWLDNFVVYQPDARTNIGIAQRDKDGLSSFWYLNTEKWLYPNYCEYCHNSGTRPVSLRRFVSLLFDLGRNQLGLDIKRERDRNGSYFVGLKIRGENDHEPPLITGNTSVAKNVKERVSNTNVLNRLWTMVMDKVSLAIKTVMDESTDGKGCDDKIENSDKSENSVEVKSEYNTKNLQTDVKPDYRDCPKGLASHRAPRTSEADRDLGRLENIDSVIAVGDRVTVEDCPGHWLWAQPFEVETIEGDLAKLEMVEELIEIDRLTLKANK